MFGFNRKKDKSSVKDNTGAVPHPPAESVPEESSSLFSRFKQGLKKTRQQLTSGISNLFLGKKEIDAELLEAIETQLLMADVGIEATQHIIDDLTKRVDRKDLNDAEAVFHALKDNCLQLLTPVTQPLTLDTNKCPFIILMIGINGAGKTTTIGKLAKHYQLQGKKVMLAAGDTFRAAAVEQLQTWGERNEIPVIAQQGNADSASVIYDAIQSAKARHVDILIADTAGRLHTQTNLMEELKKVKRVIQKLDPEAPHETMLILDAGTGQNALIQAQQFNEAIGVTGITLTKLDGTAKGGLVFAIAKKLKIPIRYLGVGEGIDDLNPFEAQTFVDALLTTEL